MTKTITIGKNTQINFSHILLLQILVEAFLSKKWSKFLLKMLANMHATKVPHSLWLSLFHVFITNVQFSLPKYLTPPPSHL